MLPEKELIDKIDRILSLSYAALAILSNVGFKISEGNDTNDNNITINTSVSD